MFQAHRIVSLEINSRSRKQGHFHTEDKFAYKILNMATKTSKSAT